MRSPAWRFKVFVAAVKLLCKDIRHRDQLDGAALGI